MTWSSHFSFKSEPFLFPSFHYQEFFSSGTEKMKDVCRAFQKHSDSDNLLAKIVKEHIVLVNVITAKLQRWYFYSEYKNNHVFHVASWNHSPRHPLSSLQHRRPGCAFADGFPGSSWWAGLIQPDGCEITSGLQCPRNATGLWFLPWWSFGVHYARIWHYIQKEIRSKHKGKTKGYARVADYQIYLQTSKIFKCNYNYGKEQA